METSKINRCYHLISCHEDVEPWTVVGGNPAKVLKKREIRD